jgi:putative aldouronate transport system substrate-binding protein
MKRTRIIALACAAALAAGSLAFAEGQKDGAAGSAAPVPLRFLTQGDSGSPWIVGEQNDRIFQEINKRLGIKLKVEAYKQGEWQKVNVAVASGDIPDLVVNSYPSAAVSQWISDGVLLPLDPYFAKMPAVKAMCEKESWTAVNGKFYGYPFISQKGISNWNMSIRGDWLKKVGKAWPETLDDFYALSKDFVEKDPDGNGKKDTYALTGTKVSNPGEIMGWNWLFVYFAYGLPHGDYVADASGKVLPWFDHQAWRDGMKYLAKFWAEGLIDPEFVLNDRQLMEDKWFNGRAGIAYNALFRHVNRFRESLAKVDPKAEIAFGDPPKGPQGARGGQAAPKGGIYTSITSKTKSPEKAAAFLEFMVKDGRDLLTLGIEGIHYTMQNGKIAYNEAERAKDNFAGGGWSHVIAWGATWWPVDALYLPEVEPNRADALRSVEVASRNQIPSLIPVATASEVEMAGILADVYNQYYMKILTGELSVDAGWKEMSAAWRRQGGDKVLAEAQTLYNKFKK